MTFELTCFERATLTSLSAGDSICRAGKRANTEGAKMFILSAWPPVSLSEGVA